MIIVEDGSGKADANSYASAADGDAYHAKHLYSSPWTSADPERKEIALQMATNVLDSVVDWNGSRSSSEQALDWPRTGASTPDEADASLYSFGYGTGYFGAAFIASDIVPQKIKDATCELARNLLSNDRTQESDTKGIKSTGIGQGALSTVFDASDRPGILTEFLRAMIRPYGSYSATNQRVTIPVFRSA